MSLETVMAVMQYTVAQAPDQVVEAVEGVTSGDYRLMARWFCAALCMSLGALATGPMEGLTAIRACEGVARNPEAAPLITRTMIVGQAVTESVAIYTLVVALLILFIGG